MSEFKLYIKHNKDLIPLTLYNSNDNQMFYAATYDEQVKFQTNNYFELTFKISYYINRPTFNIDNNKQSVSESNKIENPFVKSLQSGTVLRLVDKNKDVWDCIITSIKYNFHPDNIIIEYSASDIFAYQMSRRAMGYTITNDDTNTIGALPFDSWAIKIKNECNINWTYNPIDSINEETIRILSLKEGKNSYEESFNDIKSFDCSGSSAYDALKKLGEAYGMQLKLNYEQQSFGFIPTKNPVNRGFYLTPNVNLKSLDISTDAQSQTTMLNVTGPTDSLGNEISILGVTPPVFLAWFGGSPAAYHNNNTYWKDTKYYSFSAGETVNAATLSDLGFVDKDFDNSSTNDKTCTKNHTFNFSCNLYSDFLEKYYWDNYWAKQEGAKPANFVYDKISIFSMPITELERSFLNTIEAVPYLENKLIDISYFKDTSILTEEEYNNWYNKVYNTLRIDNGKLQFAVNTKLKQDSRKISMVDACITSAQLLNADIYAAINAYITEQTPITFSTNFKRSYNSIFCSNETELGNLSDLVKQYQSVWDKNDQYFLGSIYNFEQYFRQKINTDFSLSVITINNDFHAYSASIINQDIFRKYWELVPENSESAVVAWTTFNCQTSNALTFSPHNLFDSFDINYAFEGETGNKYTIKIIDGTLTLDSDGKLTFDKNGVVFDGKELGTITLSPVDNDKVDEDNLYNFSGIFSSYKQEKSNISIVIYKTANFSSELKIKQLTLKGSITSETVLDNGNFYAQNYSNGDSIAFQKVVDITGNLDFYWNNAFNTGVLCGYWIPKSWHYYFTYLETGNKTSLYKDYRFCPIKLENNSFVINNLFLPEIKKLDASLFTVSDTNSESALPSSSISYAFNTNETTYCKYSWTFDTKNNLATETEWIPLADYISSHYNDSTATKLPIMLIPKYSGISFSMTSDETIPYAIDPSIPNNKNAIQWFFQPLIGFNETRYIACRLPTDSSTSIINLIYNTDDKKYMRCSIRGILNAYFRDINNVTDDSYDWFSTDSGSLYKKLDGLNPMIYSWVFQLYKNQHYTNSYLIAKEKVLSDWNDIYTNYDNLLIENTYENNSALTPSLLLSAAKQKFQELREPEPNYNVSMLDVYNDDLQLNGKLIISDQIGLSLKETDFVVGDNRSYTDVVDDEQSYSNKLKQLITKTLFVTEISYSLRQDQAVTITVNPVRYGDVLIDRLVKLL